MIYYILIRSFFLVADCYDPLDPNGNITVTFDIFQYTDDGYVVSTVVFHVVVVLP